MKPLIFAAALLTAGAACAQTPVPPANTAPERDSRGVPVVSDPATAPAGANQPLPALPPGAVGARPIRTCAPLSRPQPSTGEKPPCSRTVTDNCTQTYERGARRAAPMLPTAALRLPA